MSPARVIALSSCYKNMQNIRRGNHVGVIIGFALMRYAWTPRPYRRIPREKLSDCIYAKVICQVGSAGIYFTMEYPPLVSASIWATLLVLVHFIKAWYILIIFHLAFDCALVVTVNISLHAFFFFSFIFLHHEHSLASCLALVLASHLCTDTHFGLCFNECHVSSRTWVFEFKKWIWWFKQDHFPCFLFFKILCYIMHGHTRRVQLSIASCSPMFQRNNHEIELS